MSVAAIFLAARPCRAVMSVLYTVTRRFLPYLLSLTTNDYTIASLTSNTFAVLNAIVNSPAGIHVQSPVENPAPAKVAGQRGRKPSS